ncbi:MAG: hypothetical protein ABJ308_07445 [Halieaceae bacterium]
MSLQSTIRGAGRPNALISAALGGLVIIVFGQTLGFDYVNFDDGDLIRRNERLGQGFSLEFLRWAFTTTDGANWNPLLWLSYALDRLLIPGPSTAAHHAANLIYHWLNSVLVFLILQRLQAQRAIAFVCAAIFAIHPQNVEAVAWIMARKDLLSTLFGLLAVLLYLKQRQAPTLPRPMILISLLMLISISVKPMFVTLPCILLLLDYWPLGRGANATLAQSLPKLILEKWPLFAVTLLGAFIGYFAHDSGGALVDLPLAIKLGNVVNAYWLTLSNFFVPAALSPYYPIYAGGLDRHSWMALALLLGISLLAWKYARQLPFLAAGWCWFLGTLFPVSGVIHFGIHGAADRFNYVPGIGLIWVSVMGICLLLGSTRLRQVAASAVIVLGASLSWMQAGHWQNGLSLFRQAHKLGGDEPFVLSSLAFAHWEYGMPEEAIQYNLRGLESLNAGGITIAGTEFKLWRNGGSYLAHEGKLDAAIYYLENALTLNPDSPDIQQQLRELREQQAEAIEP